MGFAQSRMRPSNGVIHARVSFYQPAQHSVCSHKTPMIRLIEEGLSAADGSEDVRVFHVFLLGLRVIGWPGRIVASRHREVVEMKSPALGRA